MISHLSDAWARRGQPNIVFVHYEDLSADLDGEMRHLAHASRSPCPRRPGPGSCRRPRSAYMRDHTEPLTGPPVIIKHARVFSRRGTAEQAARS